MARPGVTGAGAATAAVLEFMVRAARGASRGDGGRILHDYSLFAMCVSTTDVCQ